MFVEPHTQEEFIYSGDANTHMVVRVFSSDGIPLYDIPLKDVSDSLNEINSFTLIHQDSLFVLEDRGRKYAIVDKLGRVIRTHSLEPALCDANGDRYSLYANTKGLPILGNKIFCETDWVKRCVELPVSYDEDDPTARSRHHFRQATRKCKLAVLDITAEHSELRFGACDILQHLIDTPRCTVGGAHRAVLNGRIFLYSPYSPFVHVIDTSSLKPLQQISIPFEHGTVGITPPPISAADMADGHNIRLATKSYIITFTYDTSSEQYLAVVYHEVPESSPKENRGAFRKWSLIVLDSTFAPVEEHVLDGAKYSGSVLLSTSSGTWVLERRTGLKAMQQPKVFSRLNL